jgi:hypothetical protein
MCPHTTINVSSYWRMHLMRDGCASGGTRGWGRGANEKQVRCCRVLHTSAYVSLRQHKSVVEEMAVYSWIRQHTSAYVSITSAYVSITSAYVSISIRQHTSAYISIRQHQRGDIAFSAHKKNPTARVKCRLQCVEAALLWGPLKEP